MRGDLTAGTPARPLPLHLRAVASAKSKAVPELYSQPPMERTAKSPAVRGAKSWHGSEKVVRFLAGAAVEVRIDDDGFRGAWYEATVIGRISHRRYQVVYVSLVEEHDPSQPLSEVVRVSDIRPRPPPMLTPSPATTASGGAYGLHDLVEAFHNDGWWAGVISAVIHGPDTGRYIVSFPTSREEVEFEASKIRYHLHWVDAQWLTSAEMGAEEAAFTIGAHVQVSRQREILGMAWFDANIIEVLNSSTYLVGYENLISENGGLLTEIVDDEYIRPLQRNALKPKDVGLNDKVEVLHHGGWVLGEISKVLDGSSYIVKICHDRNERKFDWTELRHSQHWDGKQWVVKFQQKTTKSPARSVSSRQNSQGRKRGSKRGRPPRSVSTSSDDGEVTCERRSFKLKLNHKKAAVQLESTRSCKKSKKYQLSEYQLKPRCGLLPGRHATLMSGVNFCAAMPMVEHNSSMEQHHSENPSFGEVVAISNSGTALAPNTLSSKLFSMSNMNGLAEIPIREEPPPDICKWRNHRHLDRLAAFVTKKRTKSAVRKSINDNVQDESNKKSRENHVTKLLSEFSTSPTIFPRKFKSSKKSAKEVILSNSSGDKDESSGQDLSRDKSLALSQKSNALRVQGSPSIVDIVANSQVSNAISIYRVSKQLDHGHFSYIAPLKERPTAKNLTIEFLMAQSSPDIISRPVETDGCREICDSNTRVQIIPSVFAKDCTQINQHKAAPETLPSENAGALNDPSPSSVASPLMEVQLPFQKTSSMWELIESMEVFKVMKQQPHFQTLELYSMEFREGMAIGLMVSFANLFASVQEVNMDEAQASLTGKLRALGTLEANGFDVRGLRPRLQELLEMQARRQECRARKAELEAKILAEKVNNDRLDFLAATFDRSIEELEQNLTSLREKRDLVIAQRSHNLTEITRTGNECSLR